MVQTETTSSLDIVTIDGAGGFQWDDAMDAVRSASAHVGLDAAGARPLRIGENAVVLLTRSGAVARVARTVDYLDDATKEVSVARWLAELAFPAVRVMPDLVQPVVVGRHPVTFWRAVGDGSEEGTTAELARVLRCLHRLTPPSRDLLPRYHPFRRTRRRLANVRVAEEDRTFLLERVEALTKRYRSLRFALPPGPVHGDAHTGNLLRGDDGTAVLIDFEAFSYGPPEWDLVLTAMCMDSYGWNSREQYDEFAEIYGFDVLGWDGYPVLRDIQETMMVSWIAQNIADERAAEEYQRRMYSLRTGRGRELWSAF